MTVIRDKYHERSGRLYPLGRNMAFGMQRFLRLAGYPPGTEAYESEVVEMYLVMVNNRLTFEQVGNKYREEGKGPRMPAGYGKHRVGSCEQVPPFISWSKWARTRKNGTVWYDKAAGLGHLEYTNGQTP
jgi:hypothetical protein